MYTPKVYISTIGVYKEPQGTKEICELAVICCTDRLVALALCHATYQFTKFLIRDRQGLRTVGDLSQVNLNFIL